MKRGILFRLLFLLFPVLCLVSCSDSSSEPDYANAVVDPRLVGDWYSVQTTRQGAVYSDFNLKGFTIRADKSMRGLGIELATGRIQPLAENHYLGIIKAKDGEFNYRYRDGSWNTDNIYNYTFENNTLILRGIYDTVTYRKTSAGFQVMEENIQSFLYRMDTVWISSLPVHTSLSATALIISPGRVQFRFRSTWLLLTIVIDGYTGAGLYPIDFHNTYTQRTGSDVLYIEAADSTYPGFVNIEEADNINKVLKGTFSLNTRWFDHSKIQFVSREFRFGVFQIPFFE